MIGSFSPVCDENSRLLVVGTMPSPASLQMGFYYGHPQNAFWHVLSDSFRAPLPKTVEEKRLLLYQNGVALWDTLALCEREGASDSAIRNAIPNDLAAFFRAHPRVARVLANGSAAYTFYMKGGYAPPAVRLPSTSPAYTMPYADKLAAWRNALTEEV